MRWRIVRTLVGKEARRLAGNRGAIVLAALLVAAAGLLSAADPGPTIVSAGVRPVGRFWVDYWQDGSWIQHLRANVPDELRVRIGFRAEPDIPRDRRGTLQYGSGEGAVQIRPFPNGGDHFKLWFWYPGADPAALAPFEEWFLRETRQYYHDRAVRTLPPERQDDGRRVLPPPASGDPAQLSAELDRQYRDRLAVLAAPGQPLPLPEFDVERTSFRSVDLRSAGAPALAMFALFFLCVYLQSSLTCEERERGVLLAQALSPATAAELVAAKAIVYPAAGVVLGGLLAGICQPAVLAAPFFWLSLAISSLGLLGIGVSIASLARTQRGAGMAALSYTLAVALLVLTLNLAAAPFVPWLLIEYHMPRLFQASIEGTIQPTHWLSLVVTVVLSACWLTAGLLIFRSRGWQ